MKSVRWSAFGLALSAAAGVPMQVQVSVAAIPAEAAGTVYRCCVSSPVSGQRHYKKVGRSEQMAERGFTALSC